MWMGHSSLQELCPFNRILTSDEIGGLPCSETGHFSAMRSSVAISNASITSSWPKTPPWLTSKTSIAKVHLILPFIPSHLTAQSLTCAAVVQKLDDTFSKKVLVYVLLPPKFPKNLQTIQPPITTDTADHKIGAPIYERCPSCTVSGTDQLRQILHQMTLRCFLLLCEAFWYTLWPCPVSTAQLSSKTTGRSLSKSMRIGLILATLIKSWFNY